MAVNWKAHYETWAGIRSGNYRDRVLADRPLGYWRLGDSSLATMADSSGNAHPGAYVGSPTLGTTGLVPGDTDTAVTFGAANSIGEVPYAAWMDVTEAFAVEAIIKPSSFGAIAYIFARRRGQQVRWFSLALDSTGRLFVRWMSGNLLEYDSSLYGHGLTAALTAGQAYHVVGTVFSDQKFTIWVNGEIGASGYPNTTNTPLSAVGLAPGPQGSESSYVIGARREFANIVDRFPGVIDEVAVYIPMPPTVAPPARLFPRSDDLGVGSGRRFPPPNSQQRSGRRFGYY